MTISCSKSDDDHTLTILLPEEFDFRVHREFRNAQRNTKPGTQYVLDFSHTAHMDSSALGMLLLMREEHATENTKIKIINCRKNIRALLSMANFQTLFDIS
jgi:anti-anti-sigma factor